MEQMNIIADLLQNLVKYCTLDGIVKFVGSDRNVLTSFLIVFRTDSHYRVNNFHQATF
jgi:hypothetical protein